MNRPATVQLVVTVHCPTVFKSDKHRFPTAGHIDNVLAFYEMSTINK